MASLNNKHWFPPNYKFSRRQNTACTGIQLKPSCAADKDLLDDFEWAERVCFSLQIIISIFSRLALILIRKQKPKILRDSLKLKFLLHVVSLLPRSQFSDSYHGGRLCWTTDTSKNDRRLGKKDSLPHSSGNAAASLPSISTLSSHYTLMKMIRIGQQAPSSDKRQPIKFNFSLSPSYNRLMDIPLCGTHSNPPYLDNRQAQWHLLKKRKRTTVQALGSWRLFWQRINWASQLRWTLDFIYCWVPECMHTHMAKHTF